MMDMQLLKENPVKSSISILTLVSMLVGAVITVDSRYVKADDLTSLKVYTEKLIVQQGEQIQSNVNSLRKQMLEEKLYDLESVHPKRRSSADNARIEKYKRDLRDLRK